MNHAYMRRHVERQTAELNRLQSRQEALLREAIRAELRAYNHTNPLATELVLYEGMWDSIKSVVSKAADYGREVAQDFKKGWERVSSAVSEALSSLAEETISKAKSFLESLKSLYTKIKEKVQAYGAEKIRRFVSVFKDHHGDLHDEVKAVAEESKTNGCAENAVEALGDKAESLDGDGTKVQVSMDEARRMVAETHRVARRGSRRMVNESRLLKETVDPFTAVMLGFGAIMLIFKVLSKVLKFLGGPCSSWCNSAADVCDKAYNKMHHFEQGLLDTLIPDVIAAGFYDFYLFCGFAAVKGDKGRTGEEGSLKSNDGYAAGQVISQGYEKGKLVGKMGSRRSTKVEELEQNDEFRRSIKEKMYQLVLLIMLGGALWHIGTTGLSILYGTKAAVKTGELALGVGSEVAAAARAV